MGSKKKPIIDPFPDGPYLVQGLENLSNRKGPLRSRSNMALCRCGGSGNKPFCDGTHAKIGFSSAKDPDRVKDERRDYEGRDITIHDNRGICAHIGFCTDGLPEVFRQKQKPWIDPDASDAEKIAATIRKCPSGALSYSRDGVEHRDREGEPALFVSPDGPYMVSGGPALVDSEWGEGASQEHYALCRCGGSKNKPFCDGTHWYIEFKDDEN